MDDRRVAGFHEEIGVRRDLSVELHMSAKSKKTGQICWREKLSVSDLESSSLAGFFCAYLVQSMHAPHSRQVNAARAS